VLVCWCAGVCVCVGVLVSNTSMHQHHTRTTHQLTNSPIHTLQHNNHNNTRTQQRIYYQHDLLSTSGVKGHLNSLSMISKRTRTRWYTEVSHEKQLDLLIRAEVQLNNGKQAIWFSTHTCSGSYQLSTSKTQTQLLSVNEHKTYE